MLLKLSSELPLGISRVQGSSRAFSYTEFSPESSHEAGVNTVVFGNSKKTVENVVLEFDFSTLWPKESQAAIKVFQGSFLLELASQLRSQLNMDAHVGDEAFATQNQEMVSEPYLDIIFPRHIFRCRVFYPYMPSVEKNAHLLVLSANPSSTDISKLLKDTEKLGLVEIKEEEKPKQKREEKNSSDSENEEDSTAADEEEEEDKTGIPDQTSSLKDLKELWWRPRIREGLHTLALEHPAYAPTVKLAGKWLSSQMCLDGYEDFCEHLSALVFTRSSANSPLPFGGSLPTSSDSGLLRFLWLLVNRLDGQSPLVLTDAFCGAANTSTRGVDTLGLERSEKLSNQQQTRQEAGEAELAEGENSTANTSLSGRQLALIQDSYNRRRFGAGKNKQEDAAPLYSICSRYDPHGVFVNIPPPSKLALLQEQAKKVLKLAADYSGERDSDDIEDEIFQGPEFDLVIDVQAKGTKKNKADKSNFHQHFTAFTPVLTRAAFEDFKKKLTHRYSEIASIYSQVVEEENPTEGAESNPHYRVGLKWRPDAFNVEGQNKGNATRLISNGKCPYTSVADGIILPDTAALIQDIKLLLDGLRVDIEM